MKKIILITGGCSGIGLEISKLLNSQHHSIIILDKKLCSLEKHFEYLDNINQFQCDITIPEEIDNTVKQISKTYQKIDVLINNAGICTVSNLEQITLTEWNHSINTNLTGAFLLIKATLNLLKISGKSQIINIASVSGMVGIPKTLAYNVSKAGLIELTKTLALELAPNIRVNAICPGFVLTPLLEAENKKGLEVIANNNPLKRFCTVSEIANLVSYLISNNAEYFNGSSLIIDGGETAGGLASSL